MDKKFDKTGIMCIINFVHSNLNSGDFSINFLSGPEKTLVEAKEFAREKKKKTRYPRPTDQRTGKSAVLLKPMVLYTACITDLVQDLGLIGFCRFWAR